MLQSKCEDGEARLPFTTFPNDRYETNRYLSARGPDTSRDECRAYPEHEPEHEAARSEKSGCHATSHNYYSVDTSQ